MVCLTGTGDEPEGVSVVRGSDWCVSRIPTAYSIVAAFMMRAEVGRVSA